MDEENRYSPASNWAKKTAVQDNEPLDRTIFFTRLRQAGKTTDTITFLLREQKYHTLATNEIEEMFYSPEQGIFLFFPMGTVHIEGRNLEALYQALRERKVTEIREFSDQPDRFFDKEALLVSRIHYESENLKRRGL